MSKIGRVKPRVRALEKKLDEVRKTSSWNVTFVNVSKQSIEPLAKKIALKYSLIFGS